MTLPAPLTEQLKRESIYAGAGPRKVRHLRPPHNVMLEGTPLWMTRCGLEWPDQPWFEVIPFTGLDESEWCEACLEQAGVNVAAKSDDLYELAIREWIARACRDVKASDVRNVRFGIDYGYSSDVTPPEDPEPSIVCEVRRHGKWTEQEILTPSPVELVKKCLTIVEELRLQQVG